MPTQSLLLVLLLLVLVSGAAQAGDTYGEGKVAARKRASSPASNTRLSFQGARGGTAGLR
jgi:hypothetical protein